MTKYVILTVFLTCIIQIICGQSFTESIDDVSFDMVWVKGGTFNMGCTAEQGHCPDNNIGKFNFIKFNKEGKIEWKR